MNNMSSLIKNFIKKRRTGIIVIVPLFLISLLSGTYAHYPVSITNDPAIHSEIVNVMQHQGYPSTWEPYAVNDFTYPPLFHFFALLLNLLGVPAIDSVRIIGIILWALLPVAAYAFGSVYGRKTAMLSAFMSLSLPFLSNVFIFGEFPQLMATELLIMEIYFLKKGKYAYSGIAVGLAILSHPFIAVVSFMVYLYFVLPISLGKIKNFLLIPLPFVVSLPWITKYMQIFFNMYSGTWQNTVYNEYQPAFWFWPADTLAKYLFDFNYFTPIVLLLCCVGLAKTEDKFLRSFFMAAFLFSVFHLPYTQLKVFDVMAVPSLVLAPIGILEIAKRLRKCSPKYGFLAIAAFIIIMSSSQTYHFYHAKNFWTNPEISPEPPLYATALWLGEYDKTDARIYVDSAPAWLGALSHKIPLEPEISYLERFSENYVEQQQINEMIKEKLMAKEEVSVLARNAGLKYVITKEEADLDTIHSGDGWFVYAI